MTNSQHSRKCPECGKEFRREFTSCHECGTQLVDAFSEVEEAETTNWQESTGIALIALAIVIYFVRPAVGMIGDSDVAEAYIRLSIALVGLTLWRIGRAKGKSKSLKRDWTKLGKS